MAHIQPRYSRRRVADYAKSTVWIGLGLTGLSLAAVLLFLAYVSLSEIVASGATVSIRGPVSVSVVGAGTGVVMSLLGFAIGFRAEGRDSSASKTETDIAA